MTIRSWPFPLRALACSLLLLVLPVAGARAGDLPALRSSPSPAGVLGMLNDGAWAGDVTACPRQGAVAVYDSLRDRILVFGGTDGVNVFADVWQLTLGDNPSWSTLSAGVTIPPARTEAGVAYDPLRDRLIVCGGRGSSGNALGDVWALSLSGPNVWNEIRPEPPLAAARYGHGMVYDPAGDRMVLFGGYGAAPMNDLPVLSLSGTPTWGALSPAGPSPSPRYRQATLLDATRRRLVVFGGVDASSYRNDVWVLSLADGASWELLATTGTPPSSRYGPGAMIDPVLDRLVVFGGRTQSSGSSGAASALTLGATHAWTTVTQSTARPSARELAATAVDTRRGQWLLIGGTNGANSGLTVYGDAWRTPVAAALAWSADLTPPTPTAVEQAAGIYDPVRRRMLVYGGLNGTVQSTLWALGLDGTPQWTLLTPVGSTPPALRQHTAVYDPVRDRMVVYGGLEPGSSYSGDVWALDLAEPMTWHLLAPASPSGAPDPRAAHVAIYDPVRDRMIVHGGIHLSTHYADTWALSLARGGEWQPLAPGGVAPQVYGHSAIYDARRDRMIVFGGRTTAYTGYFSNAVDALSLGAAPAWTRMAVAGVPPSARDAHTAIYDPLRDRMVVYGGQDDAHTEQQGDVWDLALGDAPAWEYLAPVNAPLRPRREHVAVYDADDDRMVVFGGYGGETWNDAGALGWGQGTTAGAWAVHPERGGDTGEVTLELDGCAFVAGMHVGLGTTGGVALDANTVRAIAGGSATVATFNLAAASHGVYDVVVTAPGGPTRTFPAAFTVETGTPARLWVQVTGRAAVRVGREASYVLEYGNDGNVDATAVPLMIRGIPLDASWTLSPELAPPALPAGISAAALDSLGADAVVDSERVLQLVVARIPAGSQGHLRLALTWNGELGASAVLQAGISDSHFTNATSIGLASPSPAPGGPLRALYTAPTARECEGLDADFINEVLAALELGNVPLECIRTVTQVAYEYFGSGLHEVLDHCDSRDVTGCVMAVTKHTAMGVYGALSSSSDCNLDEALKAKLEKFFISFADRLYHSYQVGSVGAKIVICNLEGHSTIYHFPFKLSGAHDPNDLQGPNGIGASRYVGADAPLTYRVEFENAQAASAPAAEVVVSCPLDPSMVDPATFELGPLTLSDRVITPPAHVRRWTTLQDLRPATNLIVRISAGLDAASGIARWSFVSLDPATGQPAEDPLAGFLPPNAVAPQGEGSVSYLVRPRANLSHGSPITASAAIVFDANGAMTTPAWTNTTDAELPVSHVQPLTPVQGDSSFVVSWAGSDAGSGLSDYTVYASQDGGPFKVWLRHTSATSDTFYAANGRHYGFYSIARDSAGNEEPPKSSSETSTGVVSALASLISADAGPGVVRLQWWLGGGPGAEAALLRSSTPGEWAPLATVQADGSGRASYEDHDVTAGSRYGYRLVVGAGMRETVASEVWVDAPAHFELSLSGVRPNPAVGIPSVAFSLANTSPARLEIFDVSGRRVLSRPLNGMAPGMHVLQLEAGARLPAGIYQLRLSQGTRSLTRSAVIVR